MKTLWIALIFLGFSLAINLPALSQNSENNQPEDIAAIEQVRTALDTAWNQHDAAALSALFLDDADFQWHTGELLKNRMEIEKYFSEFVFKFVPAEYRHHTTFQRLRFLSSAIAVGDGTIVVAREGALVNEKPYLSVLFTCVGKKENNKWYIAAVRLMQIKND